MYVSMWVKMLQEDDLSAVWVILGKYKAKNKSKNGKNVENLSKKEV